MVGIDLKISVPEDINIDTENEFSILKIELGIHDTEKDTKKILVSSILYAPSTKEFEDSRYLSSTEFIKFDDNYLSTRMAKLIRDDSVSDEQFIMRVFMLVSDIEYDNEFIEQGLNSPFYIPNADKTLVTNKGICSDQAVLLAVMLRSQGIPTRYISGLHLKGHAWNEILINGEWIPVDATSGRFSIDSNYIPRIRY
ncbi:MAG: transglutaminase domain-containing protein [Clostridiales bacterium]|nr:transglutaminase domain-containing protein [Clostridiales bacterium]